MFTILIGWATKSLGISIEQLDSAGRDLALSNERANRTNFRLAAIIESSDDAIISKSLDGTITSWNAGAERIFGYPAAEAIGQSMRMLLPTDRLLEEVDILRRISAGQSVEHFESIRVRKDGAPILVSITISPLRDATGAVVGASKIARDITETRRIERSIEEKEARLSAIIGAAMDAVITVNEAQHITMFNPAAEAMFGCSASGALGDALERFLPARFRAEHSDRVREFGRANVTRRRMGHIGSIYGVRSNGDEFPIEASISHTEVHGEKLFTVILRDVTERKNFEQELRQQAVLLDLAPVLVRDLDNRIVLWTRGAQKLYGFTREQAVGRISHELLQTQFPAPLDQLEQALNRDGTWEGEIRHHTLDGRTVFVASQWLLHYDAQGKPSRLLEINADLTELKKVQTTQMRSQKLESLGTLAGGVAHNFNNILLAINAKMALEDLSLDQPVRQNLSEIAKAGARAADLVRHILAFSRPEEPKREPGSVQPVVEEALRLVRATLPAAILIETHFDPDLPWVSMDSSQIHQIIVNLATNASHAIGDQLGTITVRLYHRDVSLEDCLATRDLHVSPYICISVSDSGSGMDRAILNRVFDPFFTTKPVGKGTGLGLSVVHGIVTSYGGAISVYSQLGQGTSFLLYFPSVAASASSIAPVPVRAPTAHAGHQENILYVDDEEGLVVLGTLFLQRLGYQVTGHVDAAAALEDFRARPDFFAAAVTDLSMPRMSGFDLVRQLLAIRPDLPVLLTSGYVRPEEETLALKLGIRRIILKPSTMDDLGQALTEALQTHPAPNL